MVVLISALLRMDLGKVVEDSQCPEVVGIHTGLTVCHMVGPKYFVVAVNIFQAMAVGIGLMGIGFVVENLF